MPKKLLIIFALLVMVYISYPQDVLLNFKKYNSHTKTSSTLYPVSLAAAIGLYLLNPILIYDNKKLFMGITKEVSVGFGYFGEHRFGIEYSFIVSGQIRHHFRAGYKYDYLLNSLAPSNSLQGTGVISPGAGYFSDFDKQGVFSEISAGYSLRNHKLLIYPHIKLRHTFMFEKDKSDITDFSFGFIFGFANPFIDLKIRRNN